jgi:ankyrin repeat protein
MVEFLISRGADVNTRAFYGCTPLHFAAFSNDVETGRVLVEHGADPNIEFNGEKVPDSFLALLQQDKIKENPTLQTEKNDGYQIWQQPSRLAEKAARARPRPLL